MLSSGQEFLLESQNAQPKQHDSYRNQRYGTAQGFVPRLLIDERKVHQST